MAGDHSVLGGRHVFADDPRDAVRTGRLNQLVQNQPLHSAAEYPATHQPRIDEVRVVLPLRITTEISP